MKSENYDFAETEKRMMSTRRKEEQGSRRFD